MMEVVIAFLSFIDFTYRVTQELYAIISHNAVCPSIAVEQAKAKHMLKMCHTFTNCKILL